MRRCELVATSSDPDRLRAIHYERFFFNYSPMFSIFCTLYVDK